MTYRAKPEPALGMESSNCLRDFALKLSQNRYFENGIILSIILNTIVMSLIWFGQSEEFLKATEVLNYIFMVIFTLEALIKIVAL